MWTFFFFKNNDYWSTWVLYIRVQSWLLMYMVTAHMCTINHMNTHVHEYCVYLYSTIIFTHLRGCTCRVVWLLMYMDNLCTCRIVRLLMYMDTVCTCRIVWLCTWILFVHVRVYRGPAVVVFSELACQDMGPGFNPQLWIGDLCPMSTALGSAQPRLMWQ